MTTAPHQYRIAHDYRDTCNPRHAADQFLGWLNVVGAGMPNSPGIRPVRFLHRLGQPAGVPAYLVLVTHGLAGPSYNPWDDTVDYPAARITYWGDAKFDPTKSQDQFRGNKVLRAVWDAVLDLRHPFIPPILHFSKPKRGVVRFNGLCALENLELTWFVDKGRPVKNYRCQLAILDSDTISPAWLKARAQATDAMALDGLAPPAWRAYQNRRLERMDVWRQQVLERSAQLPPEGSVDAALLAQLAALSPLDFECAVVGMLQQWNQVRHSVTQTRPTSDGGFDFFGYFTLPTPLSYRIEFRGEAKRWSGAVGAKDVSRLVARLGRGEYGLFVTTSYYTEQAQREVLEDGYPVKLLSGADLVRCLRELRLAHGNQIDPGWLASVRAERTTESVVTP